MESISCSEAGRALLSQALGNEPLDPERIQFLAAHECSESLFRIVAEGLADRFERRLADAYIHIFSEIFAPRLTSLSANDLRARYERVRQPRVCRMDDPLRVVVLSRVTLGADVAITSVLLETAKQRFPRAEIFLAGDQKSAELFSCDTRIQHLNAPYPRNATLSQRIANGASLARDLDDSNTLIIDPDSRLTQLGLIPVAEEARYFFFESRVYGGDSTASLGELVRRWSTETFEIDAPAARISPPQEMISLCDPAVAVSLGVGGNEAKRLPEAFEGELLTLLGGHFATVVVDCGFGPDEASRVQRLTRDFSATPWTGSFARFASVVSQCEAYLGYDSAGQHAAAALGRPLLTLFKGFVSERMFERWQPTGPGPKRVLKITDSVSITDVAEALTSFFFRRP